MWSLGFGTVRRIKMKTSENKMKRFNVETAQCDHGDLGLWETINIKKMRAITIFI
jgi:hypothetical protein